MEAGSCVFSHTKYAMKAKGLLPLFLAQQTQDGLRQRIDFLLSGATEGPSLLITAVY